MNRICCQGGPQDGLGVAFVQIVYCRDEETWMWAWPWGSLKSQTQLRWGISVEREGKHDEDTVKLNI